MSLTGPRGQSDLAGLPLIWQRIVLVVMYPKGRLLELML